jgi:hypothetical protein
MTYDEKIKALAALIESQYRARIAKDYPRLTEDYLGITTSVKVKPGKKYTKIDVGGSGKYMVDEAGNIWGIKAYGVIHRGHQYGTLDSIYEWDWSEYVAHKRQGVRR